MPNRIHATLLVILLLAGCETHIDKSRGESSLCDSLRGRLYFVAVPFGDPVLRKIYEADLPRLQTKLSGANGRGLRSFHIHATPRVFSSGDRIYFLRDYPEMDICEYDASNSDVSVLVALGPYFNSDTASREIVYLDPVIDRWVRVTAPCLELTPQGFDYADSTRELYSMIRYKIHWGAPKWQFSPDSIRAPEWVRSRTYEAYEDGTSEWVDLVIVTHDRQVLTHSLDTNDPIHAVAVTDNARFVGYATPTALRILRMDDLVTLVPKLPPGLFPGDVRFATDDVYFLGSMRGQYSAVFRVRHPDYSDAEEVDGTRHRTIGCFDLSPDNGSIVLGIPSNDDTGMTFVVVQPTTGLKCQLKLNSEAGPIRIVEGIDWID